MKKILIIPSSLKDASINELGSSYFNYVKNTAKECGIDVTALMLPYFNEDDAVDGIADMFDGFLFSGGPDIHPRYFGEEVLPECGYINNVRDSVEMRLLSEIIKKDKPAFGICRGIQVMNVALGGTLYQDITSQLENCAEHRSVEDGRHAEHTVKLSGKLRDIIGLDTIKTNSYHHQTVKDVGAGVDVEGNCASDGTIEAIRARDMHYFVGVQWHPERGDECEGSFRLMQSFLKSL